MTVIDTRFSATHPISCAQGRHGEVIIVQGHGVRPARWDGGASTADAGMDAPSTAPGVTASPTVSYYIARTDVVTAGAVYYAPPAVTFDVSPAPPNGRPAKAASYLSQAALSEVLVQDGGKHYPSPPNVALGDTHGKGAVIEALLDEPEEEPESPDNPNSKKTGLTGWEITQGPPFDDELDLPINQKTFWQHWGPVTIPIKNGPGKIELTLTRTLGVNCFGRPRTIAIPVLLNYRISGAGQGSGAEVRVGFSGHTIEDFGCTQTTPSSCFCRHYALYPTVVSGVTATKFGKGYSDEDTVTLTIDASRTWDGQNWTVAPQSKALIVRGTTRGNALNTTAARYPLRELVLKNGGSGYVVAPQIKITSSSGFGAFATAKVSGGKIVSVTLENSGGGYRSAPTVEAVAGGAEAFAVARPHLRGVYQCYYRYVDDTAEEKGGPIPSNLSPVTEIDTGAGSASLQWTAAAPSGRATKIELWRTTGNQATLLYRVHTGTTPFVDDLTDEEVRNPDRPGYAAMPIVMPNGELNANRFGVPPSDKAVVVRFQDRFWYGVDTSGKQPNAVLFSEVDEPESVPDINEIILQNNDRSSDFITALVPFGSSLLLMQERHAHALTFSRQPLLDVQVSPLAYRGAINQQCWVIHDGVCYVMDSGGVYSLSLGGEVQSLSDAIGNLFREQINFALAATFFLTVEPSSRTLRAFVSYKGDGDATAPTRVLCLRLSTGAWWTEAYSCAIRNAASCRLSGGDYRNVYATAGGAAALESGAVDIGRGAVARVKLTNRGSGYTKPPGVFAAGSGGATFRAILGTDGGVDAIHIVTTGYGYESGRLFIDAPPEGGVRAEATFDATPKDLDFAIYPPYWLRTKKLRYLTDSDDPAAGGATPRHVTVLYSPQDKDCLSHLRLLYNDSESPRANLSSRNRGVGYVARRTDAAWVANIGQGRGADGSYSYRALLEGRSMADIASSDRFVAVEISGTPVGETPVAIHSVDIEGVANE